MFVLKSTYRSLEQDHVSLQLELLALRTRWNELVDSINKKGGRQFLDHAKIPSADFTPEEITTLIKAVHPDKHNGDPKYAEILRKLLLLRQ